MKLAIVGLLILISSTAFACPDLSGEYVNEEFGTYYSISQNGCDLVQFNHDEGTLDAVTDGVERLEFDYDVVVTEGSVLANIKLFVSYLFSRDRLISNQKVVTTYTSDGKVEEDKSRSEFFLNKDNDLVTVTHDAYGTSQTVDIRVK